MQRKNKFQFIKYLPGAILMTLMACATPEYTIEPFGENIETDINILASDEFEGRAPASPGGIKARDFIKSRFQEIGLKPANGDSYLQAVPLVEVTGSDFTTLNIAGNGTQLSFNYLDDMVVGSYRLEESLKLDKSELVFVGYGVVAPEYGWNDYEGLDVEGKTVVILVNDPGFATGDETMFTGNAMTYYGRWTYKFEEAARQGAAGALIIHQTEPASYGWEVVRNSWSGTQYGVITNGNRDRLPVEGWIHLDAATKIFDAAGIDIQETIAAAAHRDFVAQPLGLTASVSFNNTFNHSECHNVIGYIEGTKYPEETVIYMAHWDHLGMVVTEQGVDIYNGAIDNATGVAGIMAIAERFMKEGAPERSVTFLAVTAEESGLLGSRFYAENPLFPIATTVAGINIDALNVYGPTNDVVSIGFGLSELDDYLDKHASVQNRMVKPNPFPERGYYYRSDHFNMARQGVPMIYANGGSDFIGRDEEYTRMVQQDAASRYHAPTDVVHDLWNYDGIHQDLWLFYNVGKDLANTDHFPNWAPENEFRAARDAKAHLRRN
ncbi:M28 family metallopeptidase [Natronoflexus pectinivorans]|uniref:Zn-dependent M28 family amino/carboxypeptidase n=1 Tax=Natronoflexus pectinivorans TaxID=682526 RepID=A0A4R2GHV7_9BACT|nr:M28 family metallopeptidase [Natronoflexus pectinivorans]TCO07722.1 Zn-dependent M28 family amino/carboxypeptidase [Natronoflexus pectinivorans]